jgi:hypothetical protein
MFIDDGARLKMKIIAYLLADSSYRVSVGAIFVLGGINEFRCVCKF